jgi:hypothetical protein
LIPSSAFAVGDDFGLLLPFIAVPQLVSHSNSVFWAKWAHLDGILTIFLWWTWDFL